jgi:hypothetical protein
VVQNRMLRKTFGTGRDEVREGCRNLHIEELHDLYFPPYILTVCGKKVLTHVIF